MLQRIRHQSVSKAWKTWARSAAHLKGRKYYLTTLARVHTKLTIRNAWQTWGEHTKNRRLVMRVVNNISKK